MENEVQPQAIGALRETFPGERRVALVPALLPGLMKSGFSVLVEAGAGEKAGFGDEEYQAKGAQVVGRREEVMAQAEILLFVRGLGANPEQGKADLPRLRRNQILIGMFDPLSAPREVAHLAETGAAAYALELLPRITKAQSMDVLSSMATVAGYKAVLLAAERLPRMFPMLMTAAGTVAPAKVLVIGAGVAGLMAIATAKRLGAVVTGYDVRPAVKEQVQSLGAKFLELPLDTSSAEGGGGYAKAMDEEFYRKQRELLGNALRETDVLITTAAVPGQKAPLLITAEMATAMPKGAVIVDLAAERGGNCALTRGGEVVEQGGVSVLGPLNLPSTVAGHASQLFGRNLVNFIQYAFKPGAAPLPAADEIVAGTLLCRGGEVVHPRIRELLGQR
jgi:H+-translocating NAD(P) transhydrogenase subunit alpha